MAPQTKPRGIPITRWGPALFLIVAAALTQGAANQRLHLTADRRGLQNIAGEILTRIEQEIPADGGDRTIVVFVLGEPGLYFHLGADAQHRPRISEHFGVLAAADYESVTGQTTGSASIFLVTGPHASPLDKEPAEVRRLLREIGEWNYFPSDLVLLDEHPPGILANRETQPAEPVRLYQVTR